MKSAQFSTIYIISMDWYKTAVTPLLSHWSYSSLALLSHRYCVEQFPVCADRMTTSSNGNIFLVTGPLCGEFTCDRWIPLTKASDAEFRCFSLIYALINGWVNNREAGDLRRHGVHYYVIVMGTSNHDGGRFPGPNMRQAISNRHGDWLIWLIDRKR